MRARPIFIAIAFVAAAGLTGAVWWLWPSNVPEVSAQERVQNACNSLEVAKYYDLSYRATESAYDDPTDSITWISSMRYADGDYHSVATAEGTNWRYEIIALGETRYEFDSDIGQEWKSMERKRTAPLLPFGSNSLCPELDALNLKEVGDEVLNGVHVKRYSDKPDVPSTASVEDSFRGLKEFWVNDVLIDSDGQLLKYERDAVVIGKTNTHESKSRVRIEATISGIGEVNIIEAPEVGTTGKSNDK